MVQRKILVVEDERLVTLDIEKRLIAMNYAVATASSRDEAIDQAGQWKPDLVLMDIKLNGGLDGIEAATQLRKTMDVPILYLTAYADERTLERARVTEPYGYILKPFEERELKAAIGMALHRHEIDVRLKQHEERQRFMAETSIRLASSLDYQVMIQRATELLVPKHADWCLVQLNGQDEEIPSFAMTHSDSGAGRATPTRQGRVMESVARTGQSELHERIPDLAWLSDAIGEGHVEALRALGARSLLCAPLSARKRTLGVIVLVSGRRHGGYSVSDLAFADDLAHRLALAVDSALLYRDAQRAIRLREEVLAIVSHDLRNALSTILVGAARLSAGAVSPACAESVHRSATRMARLIGDLLDVASIDSGRLSIHRAPQSAAVLGRDAIDVLEPLAREKGVSLIDALPADGPNVVCDQDRVLQVLSNLVMNAIKFTSPGGSITLRADAQGSDVRFAVADTGLGIPRDHLSHLFDRFWQSPNAAPLREGTGLGLSIARGIVEAHGGRIWAESAVGAGSTFYFTLPTAARAEDLRSAA